jgi:ParB family transcriptional regulator, chromosome partitioning protein
MPKALRGRVRIAAYETEPVRVRQQLDEARYGPPLRIPVEAIEPNPRNPRRVFSEEALNELAESIKRWKQLQPIVVRTVGERYQLIFGERRWRAHQRAGLETIWAVEREASDTEAYALALIENMQRVDLSHAEKVAALDQLGELSEEGGLRETARQLHMSPGWLSVQLSMRKDPVVYPALEAGRVSFGQAAALLRAPAHTRRSLLDRALRKSTPIVEIQGWVRDVRRQEQVARADIGASLAQARLEESATADATHGDNEAPPDVDVLQVLRSALEQLRGIAAPQGEDQRAVLLAIQARVAELLVTDIAAGEEGQGHLHLLPAGVPRSPRRPRSSSQH